MAQSITLTIPDDAVAARVLDGVCFKTGWKSVPESGTKAAWAKQVLLDYSKKLTVEWEADAVRDSAYAAQLALSQAQIIIT